MYISDSVKPSVFGELLQKIFNNTVSGSYRVISLRVGDSQMIRFHVFFTYCVMAMNSNKLGMATIPCKGEGITAVVGLEGTTGKLPVLKMLRVHH